MLLKHIISEISDLKERPGHKSALDIFNYLSNNRRSFTEKMDEYDFDALVKTFEDLASTHPRELGSAHFRDSYSRAFNLLAYKLDKFT